MTRPEDLIPPPAERLPERSKQEMRQRLLAATAPSESSARSSWLIPALAAAAVMAIVGVGAVVVSGDGDAGDNGSTGLQPAGRGGPAVTAPPSTTDGTAPPLGEGGSSVTATRSAPPPPVSTSAPGHRHVPVHSAGPGRAGDAATCSDEIDTLSEPSLEGATVTADRDYGAGVTSLFETKSAWIVCDTWAAVDGGAPTLFAPHLKTDDYTPSVETLAISENFGPGDPMPAEYVAGGRDFDGVQSIAYTFPDGHTEDAVVGQNGLWSMTYLPTSGVLTDPSVNATTLDPITVHVVLTNGDDATYTLQWGLDTCAQVNHGC